MAVRVDSFAIVEPARGKAASEDFTLIDDAVGLLLVADGMGGRPDGGLASETAAKTLSDYLQGRPDGGLASETAAKTLSDYLHGLAPAERMEDRALQRGVAEAGQAVLELSDKDPMLAGMGTTLCAVVIDGLSAKIVHVGDSRAYLVRAAEVTQLTQDQTLAAELVARNILSKTSAERHPFRNVLAQSIGSDAPVDPEIETLTLESGDRLLLATDGLAKALTLRQILEIFRRNPDGEPRADAGHLMDAALFKPAEDDIAIVVARICSEVNGAR